VLGKEPVQAVINEAQPPLQRRGLEFQGEGRKEGKKTFTAEGGLTLEAEIT